MSFNSNTYDGIIHLDMGPLIPLKKWTKNAIDKNGVNGIEARMETVDFGRITVGVYDTFSILETMKASRDETPVNKLLSVTRCLNSNNHTRLRYDLIKESSDEGILGCPVQGFNSKGGFKKALAIHGKVVHAQIHKSKNQPSILVFVVRAGGLDISVACREKFASKEMKSLLTSKKENWVLTGGFGVIVDTRVNGNIHYKMYINSVKKFAITPDKPLEIAKIPLSVMKEISYKSQLEGLK